MTAGPTAAAACLRLGSGFFSHVDNNQELTSSSVQTQFLERNVEFERDKKIQSLFPLAYASANILWSRSGTR
jgi:hypothetical protein